MRLYPLIIVLIVLCTASNLISQTTLPDPAVIANSIAAFKSDSRGPYKDIRWFCPDGRINEPKTPCDQEGAYQRARYKDDIVRWGKENHLFLGQILTGTEQADFLDASNYFSRLKQYQLEKYLQSIDNGWINRKAQFYRGSVQVEDEMAWGRSFLLFLLNQEELVQRHFFMVRRAVQTLPHGLDDQLKQRIRALSKTISDEDSRFMSLRIKIHSNPNPSDIQATKEFKLNTERLSSSLTEQIDKLVQDMETLYAPLDYDQVIKEVLKSKMNEELKSELKNVFERLKNDVFDYSTLVSVSDISKLIRESIVQKNSASQRLEMLDYSIKLEDIVLTRISGMSISELGQLNAVICQLAKMAHATGLIESWEWEKLEGQISMCQADDFRLYDLIEFHREAKKSVEWSVNMYRAHYNPVVNLFAPFEPLANGFLDDAIRSSVLLPLGQRIGDLGQWLNRELNYNNQIEGIAESDGFRGLNPGYAMGRLEIVSGAGTYLETDKSKIYVFDQPPSDLKPVAGIATVSEGNPVSHIQLLARNLGIPNAVLGKEDFSKLKKLEGQMMFYAVSPKGTVVLKKATSMNRDEESLFEVKQRSQNRITVPTDQLDLSVKTPIDIRLLDKSHSGRLCGPKAANLAELKKYFPDNVVEGLVIPFGIFKAHMDQYIPGSNQTYWDFVNETFIRARQMNAEGKPLSETESYQLTRLTTLRGFIQSMPFLKDFENQIEQAFIAVLKAPLGKIPVFLRSDTNMEDLKDFTGAGLNLTLFNVLEKTKILQGIKDVWASPYTERSFKWRQNFLLNPENVYPSILIIPGVNVDYSGVLITKGLNSGKTRDLTVAFNRGVGGAVDGQSAESYTLTSEGYDWLEAPAREATMRYLLSTGGTAMRYTDFSSPILSDEDLLSIRWLASEAGMKIDLNVDSDEAMIQDIEFGFLDHHLWLFQVRPFVENKQALASDYLSKIAPLDPPNRTLKFTTQITNINEN